jgi:hypothetical protein
VKAVHSQNREKREMSASFQEMIPNPLPPTQLLPDEWLDPHWEVRLSRPQQSHIFQVTTETLSVGRFSFLTQESFVASEPLDCTLVVPTDSIGMPRCHVLMPCRAHVVSVTATPRPGILSVFCRVEHYFPVVTRFEPSSSQANRTH